MSSSSRSSSSSSDPKIIAKPDNKLNFGHKFKPGPIKVIHPPRRDTESGFSSIDSKPSIKQKPKNSDFNLDLPNKAKPGQAPVAKLPSMKYSKNESPSDSLSSDSLSSSVNSIKPEPRDPPAQKILVPQPLDLHPQGGPHGMYKPVLNSIDLDDSPQMPAKPVDPPLKPAIPPLPLNKIEGIKAINGPKEVKDFAVNPEDVQNLDMSSKSSESSKSSNSSNSSKSPKILKSQRNPKSSESPKSSENKKYKTDAKANFEFTNSSGSSNPQPESKKISIDLFGTPQKKVIIKSPEKHDEIENTNIDRDNPNNFQEIKLKVPNPAGLLFSHNMYSFSQLLRTLQQQSYAGEDFWEDNSCWAKVFKCCCKDTEISPNQMSDLVKLERLSMKGFDNNSEFNRDLLFSLYNRLTDKAEFIMNKETQFLLGLSSFEYKTNELAQKFTLTNVLQQLYMIENKPLILRQYTQARKPQGLSPFKILNTLMGESFRLLKKKKLNDLFDEDSNVIEVFFKFHAGLISIWVEIANRNEEFATCIRDAVDRAAKNPRLCVEIFNR